MLVFQSLFDTALENELCRVADIDIRRRLINQPQLLWYQHRVI